MIHTIYPADVAGVTVALGKYSRESDLLINLDQGQLN